MSLSRTEKNAATYLPKNESSISFPAKHTALLVIDPVNDFLSEGGAGWELTEKTVEMNDVIPHLKNAFEGARSRGIPVLFGPMAYTKEDYEDEQLQRRSGIPGRAVRCLPAPPQIRTSGITASGSSVCGFAFSVLTAICTSTVYMVSRQLWSAGFGGSGPRHVSVIQVHNTGALLS